MGKELETQNPIRGETCPQEPARFLIVPDPSRSFRDEIEPKVPPACISFDYLTLAVCHISSLGGEVRYQ